MMIEIDMKRGRRTGIAMNMQLVSSSLFQIKTVAVDPKLSSTPSQQAFIVLIKEKVRPLPYERSPLLSPQKMPFKRKWTHHPPLKTTWPARVESNGLQSQSAIENSFFCWIQSSARACFDPSLSRTTKPVVGDRELNWSLSLTSDIIREQALIARRPHPDCGIMNSLPTASSNP